jgi:hypothetical protein
MTRPEQVVRLHQDQAHALQVLDRTRALGCGGYVGQGHTPGEAFLSAAFSGKPLPPLSPATTAQGSAA